MMFTDTDVYRYCGIFSDGIVWNRIFFMRIISSWEREEGADVNPQAATADTEAEFPSRGIAGSELLLFAIAGTGVRRQRLIIEHDGARRTI